jgi:hypothetical protein
VEDSKNGLLQTYDSGIALVFDVPTHDATNVFVNYVGVFKDILKLNYRPIHTLIIIFRCEWMKRKDNRRNPTYLRDDVRFLMVNFRHKLPLVVEPFIFPSQVTQVFFSDDLRKLGWKVVFQKEVHFRKEVVNIKDVIITTTVEIDGLNAPIGLFPAPNIH